jgi:nicotinamidase-related amidase
MSPDKTLIIIDVQSKFFPSKIKKRFTRCIIECAKLASYAIINSIPIIVLEYENYGPTHLLLRKTFRNYPYLYSATKSIRDGSPEIQKIIISLDLPQNFIVCGMFLDQCVAATVIGLSNRYPGSEIEVIKEAVEPWWAKDRNEFLKFDNNKIQAVSREYAYNLPVLTAA